MQTLDTMVLFHSTNPGYDRLASDVVRVWHWWKRENISKLWQPIASTCHLGQGQARNLASDPTTISASNSSRLQPWDYPGALLIVSVNFPGVGGEGRPLYPATSLPLSLPVLSHPIVPTSLAVRWARWDRLDNRIPPAPNEESFETFCANYIN